MKNFKLFEKCNRRIARRVTLIAVLLAMCMPQAWATSGIKLRGDYVGGFSYTSDTWTKGVNDDETKRYWDVYHSGGSKFWRIWLVYYNHDGGPDNENEDYDLNEGTPAYMVVNKNKHSFVTTADPGILRIKVDQYGSDKGRSKDEYPYVWVERPDVEFKYPWDGISWTKVTATDNHDGTYTYRGTYRGVDRFNAGPNGADKIAPEGTGEGTTVIIGSPTTGRRCEFKWQPGTGDPNTDYKYTGGEEDNRGRFTITKLCTITYYANGGTGDAPDLQEVLYGADQTLRGNTGGLSKDGYVFVGWNTNSSGTGDHYNVGATLEDVEADVDLYAEWVSGKWGIKGKGGDGALGSNFETFHVLRKISTNKYKGSVSLGAHQVYEFKITDNTTWYGKSDNSKYFLGQTNSVTLSSSPSEANCIIATGNAGDYTFEFDESTGGLIVTYPNGNNHPSTNFVYYSNPSSWGTVKAYIYDNPELTTWANSPILGTPVTIGGNTYYYTALGDRNDVIFQNGSGSQTSDIDEADDEVGHYYNTSWAQFTVRITLNNQSATSAGTEYKDVKFNYDELTTSITCPTKTGYNFGGYYTETNGGGVQIINASGVWQASVSGYTDGDKKWIKDGGTATLYAKWTEKTYSVTAAVNPAGSGFVTPSSATTFGQVVGGDITASPNGGYDFYKWSVTSGSGTIDDDDEASTTFYPTATSTVTAQFCPATGSGETVFKFDVSTTSGNVCSSTGTSTINESNFSTLEGGYVDAYVTGTSQLVYATGGYIRVSGSTNPYLILNLDCPLKEGDIIKWYSAASSSRNLYFRHTSSSTSTGQITLPVPTSAASQMTRITDAFDDVSTIYITVSGQPLDIKSIEIIRPYSITLDANTNGGTVNGEETIEVTADGFTYFPRAVKSGKHFKGWYTASSEGDLITEPYLSTDGATLYAQFDETPSSGDLYSMTVKSGQADANYPVGLTDVWVNGNLSAEDGGSISAGCLSSAGDVRVRNENEMQINSKANGYWKIDLEFALQANDVISFTSSTNYQLALTYNSTRSETVQTSSKSFTIPSTGTGADLAGKSTLYLWRVAGSGTNIATLKVSRPAPVSTFDVTIASNNTDYGDVDVKSIDDVESGATITASDNELTIGETVITADPETSDAQYTYTFTGWTDDEGEDLPSTVTADLSILANFEQTTNTYAITWKNYDGTTLETDAAVEYGATPSYDGSTPTKAATAEYTYAFDEWDPAVASVTGDATYTATFTQTANNYTLAWDKNGSGDALSGSYTSGTTAYGTELTAPNTPTWDGHRFDGWNTEDDGSGDAYTGTMPAANTTYYAQWTVLHDVTITATNVTKSTGAATAAEGENYVATFSTVTGYDLPTSVTVTIDGSPATLSTDYTWSAGTLTILAASVTDDIAITVSGEAQTYTISYKDKDGDAYSGSNLASLPKSHTYGSSTNLVNGVRTGYIFNGWYGNYACDGVAMTSVGATAFSADFTLYAKWTAKTAPTQYAVTIDASTVCSGSSTNIKMAESQSGVSYQLYKGEDKVGDAKAGGSALTWSSISATGTYKVMAVENETYASREMSNTVTLANYDAVSIKTHPTSAIAATIGVGSDMSVVLNTGTFNNAAYTWQTCTDATPSSVSDISSGSQYSNYNTATMTFTPSSAGTYYFRCKVTDDCGTTVYSNVTTVTATDGPCFTMMSQSDASRDSTISHNDAIVQGRKSCKTLTGGTVKYVNASGSGSMTVEKGANKGWKFADNNDQLVITLSPGSYLQEGTTITVSGYTNSSGKGLKMNGVTIVAKSSTSGTYVDSVYTVKSTDTDLIGKNVLTITRISGTTSTLYSISISNCDYCDPIEPSLSYSKTTFWMDDDDLWGSPTLNKDGSTGAVTYTSSNSDIVWVGTYGSIFAQKRGTATITASIAADGMHCAAEATCEITVKSIDCGMNTIAKATRSGTTASYSGLDGGSALVNNLDGSSYKLKAGGYVGVQLPSSLSFKEGDKIRIDLTIGDWWNGGNVDALPVVVYADNTGTNEIYRTDNYTKNTAQVVEFSVTSSMLTALNTSKKVTVYRQSSNPVTQNHVINSVEVKRNTCPDIFVFNDAENDQSWSTAGNWVGKAGQGTGLPKDTDRVFITKSVTVDATTATAGRVHITDGAVMTVNKSVSMGKIDVETGSTLNVAKDGGSGVTLALNTLHLKGGLNADMTKYDMPRVFINSSSAITRTNTTINFDIAVGDRHYYPIALPFDVDIDDVNFADQRMRDQDPVYGTHYIVKEYKGDVRASVGDDRTRTWGLVAKGSSNKLKAGKGYIAIAGTDPDIDAFKSYLRFPMVVDNAWLAAGEKATIDESYYKNVVDVVAYTGAASERSVSNKGWNLLGVPYMSCFQTGDGSENTYIDDEPAEGHASILTGKLKTTGSGWDDDEIMYVNIPTADFSEYIQKDLADDDTKLLPGWCFFVQIDESGQLTFATSHETNSTDVEYRAPKVQYTPIVKTGITLSGAGASDKTSFLISDRFSTDYEIGKDLEKLFGETGYTLATYSLIGGTKYAYNALSENDIQQVIPIGYRAPADGEYTFSINPRYAESEAFEHVNLIDYETGIMTDLLMGSYTFSTERTQLDTRFALNVVPRKETPTDIETVGGEGINDANAPRKVLINDKMYIILDGKMYDATGKSVK